MPSFFSLRAKIILILLAMGSVSLGGSITMLWYSHQMDETLTTMVRKELVLYKVVRDMEIALANQKGFLTYYLVDGNGKWLEQLGLYRQVFTQSIDRAYLLRLDEYQKDRIDDIVKSYRSYTKTKDIAIENYRSKNPETLGAISKIHEKQRDAFFGLLEMCRTFSQEQWQLVEEIKTTAQKRSRHLRYIAYGAISLFTILCGLFFFVLYRQILLPIRGLAIETGSSPQESSRDEVVSLSRGLKGMMRDFDATHDELTRSRKHLLQAERMAMVGELAAGVAHTIRNPFTSIKMRMFSLSRSLDLTEVQHEDLKVISDEIARIDKIVQNFLEFARPPKLQLEEWRSSELIQSVISLLDYRLREYDAELRFTKRNDLPEIYLDGDRIKEALVNLITNSCEAMPDGGTISIEEKVVREPDIGDCLVITVSDNGPGIPETIRHKVTNPFFTTKEQGTGLGLSIVNRIVKEHKGKLQISSTEGEGAFFSIHIPLKGVTA